MLRKAGFPCISKLNAKRHNLFEKSHAAKFLPGHPDLPLTTRVGCWLGHKALSVISFPANAIATGLGLAGMAATACTLGAYKVIAFAATLGKTKYTFPIGFNWLAERTFSSLANIVINAGELLFDAGDLAYQGYRGVKFVLTALKMDFLARHIKKALIFVGDRLEAGFMKAGEDERKLPKPMSVLQELNEATHSRSCFKGDQPLKRWFEHKCLSVVNIPANAIVAGLAAVASIAGLVAASAKAVLYAGTNIHISIPTGYAYTGTIFEKASVNVLENSAEVVADLAVIIYRIADKLHITQAVVKVAEVVAYIPKAIFT